MPRRSRRPQFRPLAVLFDLDGVLIDTMPLHAKAWRDACRTFGLRVGTKDIYAREGEPGAVTARDIVRRAVARRDFAGTDGRRRRARRASTSPPGLATRLLAEKERRFPALATRVKVPRRWGTLLSRLSEAGLRLALVTGTSSREVRRVVPEGVRRWFDAIVTGDQVRRGKPHPGPYRKALRALRIPPGRALVVENAPYGIRSARRAGAGMILALASSLPPAYLREADEVVRSAPALRNRILRLVRPLAGRKLEA
ncbi:MAG TPA: HAD family phosphatase [bacterium]